jgi:hypothetical protein
MRIWPLEKKNKQKLMVRLTGSEVRSSPKIKLRTDVYILDQGTHSNLTIPSNQAHLAGLM